MNERLTPMNISSIRFENRDGVLWFSLTDIAKATGKRFKIWNELELTKEFLTALESDIGFPIIETIQSCVPSINGTWGIEDVALEFAGWSSLSFKIQLRQQIKTFWQKFYASQPLTEQPLTEQPLTEQPPLPTDVLTLQEQLDYCETMLESIKQLQNSGAVNLAQQLMTDFICSLWNYNQNCSPNFENDSTELKYETAVDDVATRLIFSVPPDFESEIIDAIKKVCEQIINKCKS